MNVKTKAVWCHVLVTVLMITSLGRDARDGPGTGVRDIARPSVPAPVRTFMNTSLHPDAPGISGNGTTENPYIYENQTLSAMGDHCIVVQGVTAHFIIRNCTLNNAFGKAGIYIEDSSNIIVQNCTFNNNEYGVELVNSLNCTVETSIISQGGYGVYSSSGSWNLVASNRMNCTSVNVGMYGESNTTVRDNTIRGGGGIVIQGYFTPPSGDVLVMNNTIHDVSARGISTSYSSRARIWNNTVENATLDGIRLSTASDNASVMNNTVTGNGGHGVFLEIAGFDVFVENNIITNNTGDGIHAVDPLVHIYKDNEIWANGGHGIYCTDLSLIDTGTVVMINRVHGNGIHGVHLDDAEGYSVIGNTVFNNTGSGIYWTTVSSFVVENNTVHGNGDTGIIINGLGDYPSRGSSITNNSIFDSLLGVHVSRAFNVSLVNNHVFDVLEKAFWLEDSNHVVVQGNVFSNASTIFHGHDLVNVDVVANVLQDGDIEGAYFYNVNESRFLDNEFASINGIGMVLVRSRDNLISGNMFRDNLGDGLRLEGCQNTTVTGNKFMNNSHGLVLCSDGLDNPATNTTIFLNEFGPATNATAFADQAQVPAAWDNGTHGNYWHDYAVLYPGANLNSTTTWDTPHVIDTVHVDNHPLKWRPVIINLGANATTIYEMEFIQFSPVYLGIDDPHEFFWQFGDGETSTVQDPIHQFIDVGTYVVNLTVTDVDGDTDFAGITITVHEDLFPRVALVANTTRAVAGQDVLFTPTVAGKNTPLIWTWDLGDGTPSFNQEGPVTHAFATTVGSPFTVNLTVTDSLLRLNWSVVVITVEADILPSANMQVNNTVPVTGQDILFRVVDLEGNLPLVVDWQFGDGAIASGTNVTHAYVVDGEYNVSVMVTDFNGDEFTTSILLTVEADIHVDAFIIANATTINLNQFVQLDAINVTGNMPVSISWDFGDGTLGAGDGVVHGFDAPGLYTVVMTCTDRNGDVIEKLVSIQVVPDVVFPEANFYSWKIGGVVSIDHWKITNYTWHGDAIHADVFCYDLDSKQWNPVQELQDIVIARFGAGVDIAVENVIYNGKSFRMPNMFYAFTETGAGLRQVFEGSMAPSYNGTVVQARLVRFFIDDGTLASANKKVEIEVNPTLNVLQSYWFPLEGQVGMQIVRWPEIYQDVADQSAYFMNLASASFNDPGTLFFQNGGFPSSGIGTAQLSEYYAYNITHTREIVMPVEIPSYDPFNVGSNVTLYTIVTGVFADCFKWNPALNQWVLSTTDHFGNPVGVDGALVGVANSESPFYPVLNNQNGAFQPPLLLPENTTETVLNDAQVRAVFGDQYITGNFSSSSFYIELEFEGVQCYLNGSYNSTTGTLGQFGGKYPNAASGGFNEFTSTSITEQELNAKGIPTDFFRPGPGDVLEDIDLTLPLVIIATIAAVAAGSYIIHKRRKDRD